MKFFSEHEVRKLIEETDIHDGIRGTADDYLPFMKGIELPDKHGNIVDGDKVLECLASILEKHDYIMVRDNLIKSVPILLEASE